VKKRARLGERIGERIGVDHAIAPGEIIGAIDVGSNAARMKLARVLADGSFERLHQQRDPIQPGEGLWETGEMSEPVVERLVRTMRAYRKICERERAGHVRAVATSALREARNREAVVARVREEARVDLEVVSGKEEARLIALGVLRGMPRTASSLLLDIGGGSTEIARAVGEAPHEVWSAPIGSVRMSGMFHLDDRGGADAGNITRDDVTRMRQFAQRVIGETLPARIAGAPKNALGSSGTIRAVCTFAAPAGRAAAGRDDITRAVEELVRLGPAERRKRFEAQRASIVVPGAVILETLVHHLRIDNVTPIDGGLKDGLLVDLLRRAQQRRTDPLLSDAVLSAGRRFGFDEPHALHTRDVALALFDQLAPAHKLPPDARLLLEAAAMLHDIGTAVSRTRHHKHSLYLMQHLDLPGLSDHERDLAALVARFHRRTPAKASHPALAELPDDEVRVVCVLSSLLRIADGADRGRESAVARVECSLSKSNVTIRVVPRRGKSIGWESEPDAARLGKLLRRAVDVRTD
jgi:exopolyphosphatase/guanosine-5'-triphosphate,3'-diphosphate pyrophosphatase